jgi:F-type H+-transporting ATPase subunit b
VKFDASLLVIMGIFWVAYLILKTTFFKPLLSLLEQREARITTARDTYEKAVAETDAEIAAQRARLQEARSTAAAQRDELRRAGNERRQALLSETRQQTQAEVQRAQEQLTAEVAREKQTLASRAEDLARRMAAALLGRTA